MLFEDLITDGKKPTRPKCKSFHLRSRFQRAFLVSHVFLMKNVLKKLIFQKAIGGYMSVRLTFSIARVWPNGIFILLDKKALIIENLNNICLLFKKHELIAILVVIHVESNKATFTNYISRVINVLLQNLKAFL